MEVVAIEPHGFCSGVRAAIETARRTLSAASPVFCLRELVHNETVLAELRSEGMRFVSSLEEVPRGAPVLFSAHGVSPKERRQAAARGLRVADATCPFVARAHRQMRDFAARGVPVAVVGNVEHEEVVGLLGECDAPDGARAVLREEDVEALPFPEDAPVGVVCQTTLSAGTVNGVLSVLRARYPHIEESPASDTCTATRDRQRAVDEFVRAGEPSSTGVLVVGSARSSNTARLAEIASSAGAKAWRVDGAEALGGCDFAGIGRLGVTAGASTPERVVRAVLDALTARSRP